MIMDQSSDILLDTPKVNKLACLKESTLTVTNNLYKERLKLNHQTEVNRPCFHNWPVYDQRENQSSSRVGNSPGHYVAVHNTTAISALLKC